MNKIVISTGNPNKIKEIKEILKDLDIEIVSKSDIGCEDLLVVEDGDSLLENSRKKALALKKETEFMVMADDSGLFVDALNGQPGVYSSRYGGEEGNDKKNNEKLLEELKDVEADKRTGRFKAVISLVTEDNEIYEIEGICEGHIGFEEKGSNGFGYDPLFIPLGYDKTFGELADETKNKLSHRYKALLGLRDKLIKLSKGR